MFFYNGKRDVASVVVLSLLIASLTMVADFSFAFI